MASKKTAYIVRDVDGAYRTSDYISGTYNEMSAKLFDTPSAAYRASDNPEMILKVTFELAEDTYIRTTMFSDIALEHFRTMCDFFYAHKNKVLF